MVCGGITLFLTLGVLGVLIFLAGQRLAAHVRRHPEAGQQILTHVVLPLLEKTAEEEPPAEVKEEPEVKKIKGRLV